MAKEKLILDSYEEEYLLYGIISDVKEYKLAWQLNKCLNMSFQKQDDATLEFKGGKSMSLSYFLFQHEFYSVKLIKNKVMDLKGIKNPFLMPELKNYDYLLMVEGEEQDLFLDLNPTEAMKSASFVQYTVSINIDNLKSLDNLIF